MIIGAAGAGWSKGNTVIPQTHTLVKKNLDEADETTTLDDARNDAVTFGDVTISRATLAPGYSWSQTVGPTVNDDRCQQPHIQYVLSGEGVIELDDGSELLVGAGDAVVIPPGHDVRVVGDEPVSVIEYQRPGILVRELVSKSFDAPDDRVEFDHGSIDVVDLGQVIVGRANLDHRWRWSEDAGPAAGTETCGARHVVYMIAGELAVRTDDGTQIEAEPGDAVVIPPGHDAWVVGDQKVTYLDFTGMKARAEHS